VYQVRQQELERGRDAPPAPTRSIYGRVWGSSAVGSPPYELNGVSIGVEAGLIQESCGMCEKGPVFNIPCGFRLLPVSISRRYSAGLPINLEPICTPSAWVPYVEPGRSGCVNCIGRGRTKLQVCKFFESLTFIFFKSGKYQIFIFLRFYVVLHHYYLLQ
jgi:hypothetical protein